MGKKIKPHGTGHTTRVGTKQKSIKIYRICVSTR